MARKDKAIATLNAIAQKELGGEWKPRRKLCPWCHQELHRTPWWRFSLVGKLMEGPPDGYTLIHAGPDEVKACIRAKKERLGIPLIAIF